MIYWPLPGPYRITSGFGPRKAPKRGASTFHNGIDIAAPIGTGVLAAHRGAWWPSYNPKGGNQVVVQGDGIRTGYAHLRAPPKGSVPAYAGMPAHVSGYAFPGSKIGEVGNTGVSTGPHLHFTAKKNGEFVDPRTLLGAQKSVGDVAVNRNPAGFFNPTVPAYNTGGMAGFRKPDGSMNWGAGSPLWPYLAQMGTGILSAPEGSSAVQMFGRGVQQGQNYLSKLPQQQMQQALMGLQMQKLQQQMGAGQNLAAVINRLPSNHPARVAYAAGDFKGAADILYKLSPEYIKSRAAIAAAGRTTISNTIGGPTYKPQSAVAKLNYDIEHYTQKLAKLEAAGRGSTPEADRTRRAIQDLQRKVNTDTAGNSNEAGRMAMIIGGARSMRSAVEAMMPGGKIDMDVVRGAVMNVPWTKGRKHLAQMRDAAAVLLRLETGAQANEQEIENMMARYMPSLLDNADTAADKLRRFKQRFDDVLKRKRIKLPGGWRTMPLRGPAGRAPRRGSLGGGGVR